MSAELRCSRRTLRAQLRRGLRKGLEKVKLSEMLNPVARGLRALKIKS
jgi:hypothetical protein